MCIRDRGKTFEVSVNPHQLINYGITSWELYDASAKSNINVGGDVITKSSQAYVVRGIGLINDLEEIRNIGRQQYVAVSSEIRRSFPHMQPLQTTQPDTII